MALLENLSHLETLPTPVKVMAGVGGAAGIAIFLLHSRNKSAQVSQDTAAAQSSAPPVYQLPQGALAGGGSSFVPDPNSPGPTPTGGVPSPRGPSSPNPILNPPSGEVAPVGNGPISAPVIPRGPGAVAPAPITQPLPPLTAPPVATPTPTPNLPARVLPPVSPPAPIANPMPNPSGVSSLHLPSWALDSPGNSTAEKLASFFGGSGYKMYATLKGNQWQSYGRAEAGWTDANTGLILPAAYNGTHDNSRYDFNTHQGIESNFSRWGRFTSDLLAAHPNLTVQDAGAMALSHLKADTIATGASWYDTGFDLGSVPDNYGKGVYW